VGEHEQLPPSRPPAESFGSAGSTAALPVLAEMTDAMIGAAHSNAEHGKWLLAADMEAEAVLPPTLAETLRTDSRDSGGSRATALSSWILTSGTGVGLFGDADGSLRAFRSATGTATGTASASAKAGTGTGTGGTLFAIPNSGSDLSAVQEVAGVHPIEDQSGTAHSAAASSAIAGEYASLRSMLSCGDVGQI